MVYTCNLRVSFSRLNLAQNPEMDPAMVSDIVSVLCEQENILNPFMKSVFEIVH